MNYYALFVPTVCNLQQLDMEAQRLVGEQPASQGLIEEKQCEIMENWEQLTHRADERYIPYVLPAYKYNIRSAT